MAASKERARRDRGRPRGEAVEAAVLAAALEEIAMHGIEGASVDRIAQAAEVNKTSVYRRFKTREALLAAALERVAGDMSAKLSDQGSLRNDLGLVAEEVASLLRSPTGRSLARAALVEPGENELAALATREMDKPRAAALAMVERARARREWRQGVSPEVVLGALVGALLHRALLERAPLTAAYVRQVVDLVAAGAAPILALVALSLSSACGGSASPPVAPVVDATPKPTAVREPDAKPAAPRVETPPDDGPHPATRDDCIAVVDANVVAQLRALGMNDPLLIEKRKKEMRDAMTPDIDACIGTKVSAKAIACVKAATTPEEIDRCLK